MSFKIFPVSVLVALCLLGICAHGQVEPTATYGHVSPFKVGSGFSDFRTSFGNGTIKGGTLWLDYTPSKVPQYLNGIGIEIEARDLSLNPSVTLPGERIDEAQGGLIYSWQHLKSFHPYMKTLFGYGNIDYKLGKNGVRSHDSRTIRVFGGGLEYDFHKSFGARAEYEYQFWPDFWQASNPAGSLTPSGFTFGVVYRINSMGIQ